MSELKILIVDDTKFFQAVAKGFLKQSAATVFTAGNGREALKIARQTRPHLIFMDLHMPEMDGATCCTALKADPDLQSIPVIMVITPSGDRDKVICRAAGCNEILTKPINRKTFLNSGRAYLSAIERRDRRILCRSTVLCRSNDAPFYGTIEDISETGMFVGSRHNLKKDELITMSFLVPGKSETMIETKARVVWINGRMCRKTQRLSAGFGVEFVGMTEEARESIRTFIDHGILRHHPADDELLEKTI
jgi:CheY-like chemotaxis protein